MQKNKLFWVIVPFFNEEKLLTTLLNSFNSQTDQDFKLLLINNNSTDNSKTIIGSFTKISSLDIEVINESQQGTGAAADTGCRYAISKGAKYIARTDADCVVGENWIKAIRKSLDKGYQLVFGRLYFRQDEQSSWLLKASTKLLFYTAELLGNLKFNSDYKHRHYIVVGNNMAFTSQIYKKAGGFPRNSLKDKSKTEDVVLAESIRKLTAKVIRENDVICFSSLRRIKHHGLFKTFAWYLTRADLLAEVDIR